MKRFIALLLAVLLFASLTACGGTTPASKSGDTPTGASGESSAPKSGPIGEPDPSELQKTAVDNDECSIVITGMEVEQNLGYNLNLTLENKSSEKTYVYTVDSAAINGVACDPALYAEVAPGEKVDDYMMFYGDDVDPGLIGVYTDMELTFRVFDSNDWLADDAAFETIHLYPYGEEKITPFVRQPQDSDKVIVDNDYITLIATGEEYDDIWGYTVNLFLVNKTDVTVMCSFDDVQLNGVAVDPMYATTIPAGKCKFSSVIWTGNDLTENSISKVESIAFSLRAYDYDNWMSKPFTEDSFEIIW